MAGLFDRNKRAKSAQITVRVDEQLKKRAELRMESLGMTATDAVEQLYRYIAEHGRMPLATRVVTTDVPSEMGYSGNEVMSFSSGNLHSENPKDNVLRISPEAMMTEMFEAQRADFIQNVMNVQGEDSARKFARYFLNFLMIQGVSCSNHNLFEDLLTQLAQGLDVNFTFHDVTLDELPCFAQSLPGELMDEFSFTADEARAVLHQIRPARVMGADV